MTWIDKARERHIRRVAFFVLFFLFVVMNWGDSAYAIYHIVLSARASFYDTVEGDLAQAIGDSTLPLGRSIARLVIVFLIWFVLDHILKTADWDAAHNNNEMAELRKEHERSLDALKRSNAALKELDETIQKAPENTALLSKQQNRIVEVIVELKKLFWIAENSKPGSDLKPAQDEPDLFSHRSSKQEQLKKKRRPRRRRPEPKFK